MRIDYPQRVPPVPMMAVAPERILVVIFMECHLLRSGVGGLTSEIELAAAGAAAAAAADEGIGRATANLGLDLHGVSPPPILI